MSLLFWKKKSDPISQANASVTKAMELLEPYSQKALDRHELIESIKTEDRSSLGLASYLQLISGLRDKEMYTLAYLSKHTEAMNMFTDAHNRLVDLITEGKFQDDEIISIFLNICAESSGLYELQVQCYDYALFCASYEATEISKNISLQAKIQDLNKWLAIYQKLSETSQRFVAAVKEKYP